MMRLCEEKTTSCTKSRIPKLFVCERKYWAKKLGEREWDAVLRKAINEDDYDMASLAIERGANVHRRVPKLGTFIEFAFDKGRTAIFDLLLEKRVDPNRPIFYYNPVNILEGRSGIQDYDPVTIIESIACSRRDPKCAEFVWLLKKHGYESDLLLAIKRWYQE